MSRKTRLGQCACLSEDAHNCWALRYHGHAGVSELTVDSEGGPCECDCHVDDLDEDYLSFSVGHTRGSDK